MRSNKKLVFIAKLIMTCIFIVMITRQIDWSMLKQELRHFNSTILLAVLLLMISNVILSSIKWKILLSIHLDHHRLKTLTGYYFTSMFFSKFLPGTVGGDGYRVYKIYTESNSKSAALMPIFIERLTGINTLIALGFTGGLVTYAYFPDNITKIGLLLITGALILCLISILFLFLKGPAVNFMRMKALPNFFKRFFGQVIAYQGHKREILLCLMISIIFYGFHFLNRLFLVYATGAKCSYFAIAFVITLSILIAQIPVSLNGLGLMDGSFIFLINNYGVSNEDALVAMLLFRVLSFAISLIGIYFFYKYRDSGESTEIMKQQLKSLRK
jgi:glycosyltransferase 2 family protein